MDIVYLNDKNPIHMQQSYIYCQDRKFVLPRISLAVYISETLDINDNDYTEFGIQSIEKRIQDVFAHPDLDDAVKMLVTFSGENFYESIHRKERVVYGRYGFKAEYANKTCKVAVIDEKAHALNFIVPDRSCSFLKEVAA